MNLLDLKWLVDNAIKNSMNPERVSVVFVTSEDTWGALPTVAIDDANLGFDWNHNNFLLFSKEEVYKAKKEKNID